MQAWCLVNDNGSTLRPFVRFDPQRYQAQIQQRDNYSIVSQEAGTSLLGSQDPRGRKGNQCCENVLAIRFWALKKMHVLSMRFRI